MNIFESLGAIASVIGTSAQKEARKLVSGSKYRHQVDELDLDLTYILPNLIAMGFPAVGTESIYRNSANDVLTLLNRYHFNHWKIFNVSEIDYTFPFQREDVQFFGWLDHHAPTMERLVAVVLAMDEWMSKDPDNVMVVHCMAGKSRTGTVISCYLLYKKMFDIPDKAITFFNDKRAQTPSLELPSQIRYVNMFYNLMKYSEEASDNDSFCLHLFPLTNPVHVLLTQILVSPVPKSGFQGTGWTPRIEIHDSLGYFPNPPAPKFGIYAEQKAYSEECTVVINVFKVIYGDVLVKFYHSSSITSMLLFRLQFHTSLRLGILQDQTLEYIDFTKIKLDTTSNCSDMELQVGGTMSFIPDDIQVRFLFNKVHNM